MKSKILSFSIVIALMISCSSSPITPPVLTNDIQPEYPLEATLNGLEGVCSLLIRVSVEGIVKEARRNLVRVTSRSRADLKNSSPGQIHVLCQVLDDPVIGTVYVLELAGGFPEVIPMLFL